jgi:hypothetical protein
MARDYRPQPPYLAVVRRGETHVFAFLKEQFEARGLVEVMWDRRGGDRRAMPRRVEPERRQSEQRRRLPDTWYTLGFVLVRRDR